MFERFYSKAQDRSAGLVRSYQRSTSGRNPMLSPTHFDAYPGGGHDEIQHYAGWTYASIRPIAQTVAALPLHAGREVRHGMARRHAGGPINKRSLPASLQRKSADLVEYDDHPALRLLRRPNRIMSGWALRFVTVCNLELSGCSYWWVAGTGDDRVLWPLPPAWVAPIHKGGPFSAYRVNPGGSGPPIVIPGEEMVYFHYPAMDDPLGAHAPHHAVAAAVSADEHIQTAQARSFRNGIYPGLVITAGNLDDDPEAGPPLLEVEQRQQLFHMIKRQYGGVLNNDEPLILDRLIKDIKPLTRTNREMDFLNSSKILKARIMQGHGTNPMIAGEIEGANRASSAVARRHFADHTVNPKVDLISQILTAKLAPMFANETEGSGLRIWIEQYRPDDREEARKDIEVAARFGAISRNEIRSLLPGLTLDPLDDGDSIPMPAGSELQPVGGT